MPKTYSLQHCSESMDKAVRSMINFDCEKDENDFVIEVIAEFKKILTDES